MISIIHIPAFFIKKNTIQSITFFGGCVQRNEFSSNFKFQMIEIALSCTYEIFIERLLVYVAFSIVAQKYNLGKKHSKASAFQLATICLLFGKIKAHLGSPNVKSPQCWIKKNCCKCNTVCLKRLF